MWINFIHSLNYAYRKDKKSCKIQISDAWLAKVRQISDSQNHPILLSYINPNEGLTEVLDGYQYVVNDSFGTGNLNDIVACIGNHSKGLVVAAVVNPIVVRADQLFLENGLIGFIAMNRYAGALADTKAIKTWKQASSST
jgi:HK97 family phage major capsid protein